MELSQLISLFKLKQIVIMQLKIVKKIVMKFILRSLMFEITVKLAYYQIISRVINIER